MMPLPLVLKLSLVALLTYLIGSITFAYLIGRARQRDLRREGSGNLGANNTRRVLGNAAGGLVLLLDAGKGALAVGLTMTLNQEVAAALVAAVFVVLGHNFPFWLGFQGGKGLAAAAGAALLLAPIFLGVVLGLAIIVLLVSRNVDLAGLTIILLIIPLGTFLVPLPGAWFYTIATTIILSLKHQQEFRTWWLKLRQAAPAKN